MEYTNQQVSFLNSKIDAGVQKRIAALDPEFDYGLPCLIQRGMGTLKSEDEIRANFVGRTDKNTTWLPIDNVFDVRDAKEWREANAAKIAAEKQAKINAIYAEAQNLRDGIALGDVTLDQCNVYATMEVA